MFDLLIRGGTIVTGGGTYAAELAISNGIIVDLLPQHSNADARRVVHLNSQLLLPGLVDAHVHFREPGLTHKEDFESGSRAAITGGVTTALVMPTDDPWTTSPEQFERKRQLATGRIHCDVGLQVAVGRDRLSIHELARLGAVSFEVFTADVPPEFLHQSTNEVLEVLHALGDLGVLCGVSPMEQSIFRERLLKTASRAGSIQDYLDLHPPCAEAIGVARNIILASATQAKIHVRQVSTAGAVSVLRRLKSLANVTVEVSPQNLLFSSADYDRLGVWAKASPPLRGHEDVKALREAVVDGTIDMVVTDHAPHSPSEKLGSQNFLLAPGGMPGVQTLLPAMLHLVDEGAIQVTDIVRLCCENPANRFGLGKNKGYLRPGYDADVLVLDSTKSMKVNSVDQISKAGYSIFDGLEVKHSLEQVFLRAQEVVGPNALSEPQGCIINPFFLLDKPASVRR